MPLLGLTNAQAKLAKWLLRGAGEAIPLALAWLGGQVDTNAEAPSNLEWRRVVLRWARTTPTGTVEDYAQVKFDIVNVTSDELDTSWTTTDYNNVQAALGTFRTAIVPYISPSFLMHEARYYRMQFNDVPDITRPFADTGSPVDVRAMSDVAGTQTGNLPYQVAQSVTLRTSWAKHWGRIYLPTPGSGAFDSYGRLTSTQRSGIAGAVKALFGTWHDAGFYPVIPVGQLDKQPFHGLLGVTAVVADDVPDVQRRRRPKQVAARTVA